MQKVKTMALICNSRAKLPFQSHWTGSTANFEMEQAVNCMGPDLFRRWHQQKTETIWFYLTCEDVSLFLVIIPPHCVIVVITVIAQMDGQETSGLEEAIITCQTCNQDLDFFLSAPTGWEETSEQISRVRWFSKRFKNFSGHSGIFLYDEYKKNGHLFGGLMIFIPWYYGWIVT